MKLISIVIPVVFSKDYVTFYVQKREESGPLDGLFEFPGGKIENGELPIDAALREFHEEVGLKVEKEELTLFSQHFYKYEDRTLLFYIYSMDAQHRNDVQNSLCEQKVPWENAQNIVQDAHIPAANKEFLLEFIKFHDMQWRAN